MCVETLQSESEKEGKASIIAMEGVKSLGISFILLEPVCYFRNRIFFFFNGNLFKNFVGTCPSEKLILAFRLY